MKFSIGDKVLTNPEITTQPSRWDEYGEMWDSHVHREVMTVVHVYEYGRGSFFSYECEIDDTDMRWHYEEGELIPYIQKPSMLEEAEEL